MGRLLHGPHAVTEALHRRRDLSVVYVEAGRSAQEIVEMARRAGVSVEVRSHEAMDALAEGVRHQGIVAVAGEYVYAALMDLLDKRTPTPLLLVLDCIQDPQNLGALIRSAAVFSATGVVIPSDRAAKVTPAVVRASAGATEHIPIALVTNIARSVQQIAERDVQTVAAVVEGGLMPWEIDLRSPTALVVGSEGAGVRRLVAERCDLRVTIPGGSLATLNASVAGALLLYEAQRQRAECSDT